jgi:hypothetical protein
MKKYLILSPMLAAALWMVPASAEDAKPSKESATAEKSDTPAAKGKKGGELAGLSREEREAKLKERREKADARLKELREKKKAGSLKPAEEKQLERLEERAKKGPGREKKGPKPGKKSEGPAPEEPAKK